MGEEPHEVVETMQALHDAGCDLLTITQYLRPSPRHHPVVRWVKPDEFVGFQAEAERIGFPGVLAGPLVRSSYRAGRLYQQAIEARGLTRAGLTLGRSRRDARGYCAGARPILGAWHAASPQTRPLRAARPDAAPKDGGRGRSSGATARCRARHPKLDKKRPAEGGPAEEARRPGLRMIKQAYSLTRKNDPKLPWIMLIAFVAVAGVIELVGILFGSPVPLPAAGHDHRRPGRADHLRPPGAGLGLPPGRGPARRGRVGARGHAR